MSRCVLNVLWISVVVAVIASGNAGKSKIKKTNRIVNGVPRTIEELPFMVQIRDPSAGTFCGGTLISPQHVLTAAHCFDPPVDGFKTLTVVGGAAKRSEPGVQRKIVSVTIHPDYASFYENEGKSNERKIGSKADVAIIKLETPYAESKQIKVMRNFCSGALKAADFIEVSGWGHTGHIDPLSTDDIPWNFSEQLQSVRLPVLTNEECSKTLSKDGLKLGDTNVCAYLSDHDSCVGDSGGPGIKSGNLCAVVSYGIGCAHGNYPGVYTSIHTVRKFIDEQLKA